MNATRIGRVATAFLPVLPLLISSASTAWAGDPTPPEGTSFASVADLQSAHDRTFLRDLRSYIEARPQADDLESAYMLLFNTAIDHDWFAESEAIAGHYLGQYPEGAVRPLAQIIKTMARARADDFDQALSTFHNLLGGLDQPDQEEFAVNFTEALATSATSAGKHEVAREIYGELQRQFAQSPTLQQKVADNLARLDRVGRPAPAFQVVDLDGRAIGPDDLKGKYTLIDFWATWCMPCVAELPNVEAAYAKYHDRGFEIVAISLDEEPGAVADFASERKLPWRQVHNATSGGDLVAAFGVTSIPSTYLIGPEGVIVRLDLRGEALERALADFIRK